MEDEKMEKIRMWDSIPGEHTYEPDLEYYKAENKKSDAAIVIFPGGAYGNRAEHEGKDYAEHLNSIGVDAFVLQYRVRPYRFPLPLVDARRSIRWVRHNAKKFGINPDKVVVMGSSAGGHLAAMLSTYRGKIDFEDTDEIDKESYIPNYQILCYPVVNLSDLEVCHSGSLVNLLGGENLGIAHTLDPIKIADEKTPEAFIWHTSNDNAVNVCNSLRYGEKLRSLNVLFEMHIFPEGRHGLGLSHEKPHVAQWVPLMKNWLIEKKLLQK